jgi:RHS repeat-associated protein
VLKNGVEQPRFSYDPNGRRVDEVAGGVITSYLYDGEDAVREIRGAVIFKYVHGPGIDEPVAREDASGALTYYHADGSAASSSARGGAVVHDCRYDAWGQIEAGASEPGYAFTGREWDPEIGLYYYRARYHSPSAARFLSADSFEYARGLLTYVYAANSPVDAMDPSGHYTVRSSNKTFVRPVESAMQTLQDELLGADKRSCCTAYFMNQNSTDLLAWTNAGGPPYIEPRTEKFRNNRKAACSAEPGAPWKTTYVQLSFAVDATACKLASCLIHEMDHLARHDSGNEHPEAFISACTVGCIAPRTGE